MIRKTMLSGESSCCKNGLFILFLTGLILFGGCATTQPISEELKRQTNEKMRQETLRAGGIALPLFIERFPENTPPKFWAPPLVARWGKVMVQDGWTKVPKDRLIILGAVDAFLPNAVDIQMGDEWVLLNGMPVKSKNGFLAQLSQLDGADWVTVRLLRGEQLVDRRLPVVPLKRFYYVEVISDIQKVFASSLPQNPVLYVFNEALRFIENDDELAFLIANEIAHRELGHKRFRTVDETATIGSAAVAGLTKALLGYSSYAAAGGIQTKATSYAVKDEIEADGRAIAMLRDANYTPQAARSLLERFEIEIADKKDDTLNDLHDVQIERLVLMEKTLQGLPIQREEKSLKKVSFVVPLDLGLGVVTGSDSDPRTAGVLSIGFAQQIDIEWPANRITIQGKSEIFPLDYKQLFWYARFDEKESWKVLFSAGKFKIEWIAPDGHLFHEESFTTPHSTTNIVKTELKISENERARYEGKWRVKITRGSKPFDERCFWLGDVKDLTLSRFEGKRTDGTSEK